MDKSDTMKCLGCVVSMNENEFVKSEIEEKCVREAISKINNHNGQVLRGER